MSPIDPKLVSLMIKVAAATSARDRHEAQLTIAYAALKKANAELEEYYASNGRH